MNKDKMFEDILKKMTKQLHFEFDVFLKKDNRMRGARADFYIYQDGKKEDCFLITYNSKRHRTKFDIIMTIAHELGHIRKKHLTTNSYLTLIEKEYQAEAFALDVVKKYYKEYYLRAIDSLIKYTDGTIPNASKVYAIAFQKLYDERIGEVIEKK